MEIGFCFHRCSCLPFDRFRRFFALLSSNQNFGRTVPSHSNVFKTKVHFPRLRARKHVHKRIKISRQCETNNGTFLFRQLYQCDPMKREGEKPNKFEQKMCTNSFKSIQSAISAKLTAYFSIYSVLYVVFSSSIF